MFPDFLRCGLGTTVREGAHLTHRTAGRFPPPPPHVLSDFVVNLLEPSGPVQACNGIAYLTTTTTTTTTTTATSATTNTTTTSPSSVS